jgi:hypothetical protein
MNQKSSLIVVIALLQLSILLSPRSVIALSVDITKTGGVLIYTGSVLGDEVENESEDEREESDSVPEREGAVNQDESEQVNQTTAEREAKERAEREAKQRAEREKQQKKKTEERKLIKRIPEKSGDKIKVSRESGEVKLRVENKKSDEKIKKVEELEDKRIEVSIPSQIRRGDTDEKETLSKPMQERSERQEETVELRAAKEGSSAAEFELISRNVTAKSRDADFLVDPETNQIVVTTRSGNQQVLNHLPDQALTNMRKKGLINQDDAPDLSLTELPNGEVGYITKVQKQRKLLGLFKRNVETEVLMSDQAGTVIEKPVDQSWSSNFLNWISTD